MPTVAILKVTRPGETLTRRRLCIRLEVFFGEPVPDKKLDDALHHLSRLGHIYPLRTIPPRYGRT